MSRLLVLLLLAAFLLPCTAIAQPAGERCGLSPPPDTQVAEVLGLYPDVRMRQGCELIDPLVQRPFAFDLVLHAAATGRSAFMPIPHHMVIIPPDSARRAVWQYHFETEAPYRLADDSPLTCRAVPISELLRRTSVGPPSADAMIDPEPTAQVCDGEVPGMTLDSTPARWRYDLTYVTPTRDADGVLSTERSYGRLYVWRLE